MRLLKFTVDSALLEELGERLVGKPYIALAELVKNAYDADAGRVTIKFNLGKNRVVVADDGSGMTFGEFRSFWMCVGSTHKQQQKLSGRLERPMTGSKGVGRLAVQLLAEELVIQTVSIKTPSKKLTARVRWREAVKAGSLTEARVHVSQSAADGTTPGTIATRKSNVMASGAE